MFGLSAAVRVYLAKEPADMRKSFDALAALAAALVFGGCWRSHRRRQPSAKRELRGEARGSGFWQR